MTGKELRRRRKSLGLKQRQLAKELGVASETVSRWETGQCEIQRITELAMKGLESDKARAA